MFDVFVVCLINWGVYDLNLEFVYDNGNVVIWILGFRICDFEWVVYIFDVEVFVE